MLQWQPLRVNKFKMASSDEEAITPLLNSGRIPLALDEGLRSLIEDYYFEEDDKLPRGKYFTQVNHSLLLPFQCLHSLSMKT